MSSSLFRNRLVSRIEGAIAEARHAALIENNQLAGRVREIVLEDLLKPILRPEFAVGTGKIADARGELSNQTDLVIHAPRLIPPILFDGASFGVFPVESVVATIEVKTTLTSDELQSAIVNAKRLRDGIRHTFIQAGDERTEQEKAAILRTHRALRVLFAFSSDLKVETDIERYQRLDPEWQADPAFNIICIVGKGTWAFDRIDGVWRNHEPKQEHDEVIELLCMLDAEMPKIASSRQHQILALYVSKRVTLI